MFLLRSTSRLYIKGKLREIKSLAKSIKDKRGVKGYKQRIKANKGIGSRLSYYQYSI